MRRIESHRQGIEQAMPRRFQQCVRLGKTLGNTFLERSVEILQSLRGVGADHGVSSCITIIGAIAGPKRSSGGGPKTHNHSRLNLHVLYYHQDQKTASLPLSVLLPPTD
jgi:hypothetical protein